jgi:hypothetical protein
MSDHTKSPRFDNPDLKSFRAARATRSSEAARIVLGMVNKYDLRAGDRIRTDGTLERAEHHGAAQKRIYCSLVTEKDGSEIVD